MTSRGIITKGGKSRRRVSIDFSDVEDWERLLREQRQRVDTAGDQIELKNARELADRAQRAAPRSQGRRSPASQKYGPLYRQLKPEQIGRRGERAAKVGIGSAFYGFFQERGTSKMQANPFLGPAIKKQRRPFQDDVRELVLKLLSRSRR